MDPVIDAFIQSLKTAPASQPVANVFDFKAPSITPEIEDLLQQSSPGWVAPDIDQNRRVRRKKELMKTRTPSPPPSPTTSPVSTTVSIACTGDEFIINPATARWKRYNLLDRHYLFGVFGPQSGELVPGRFLTDLPGISRAISVSREWIEALLKKMAGPTSETYAVCGENFCATIGYGIVFRGINSYAVALGNVYYENESELSKAKHRFFVEYTRTIQSGAEYPVTNLVVPYAAVLKSQVEQLSIDDGTRYFYFSVQSESFVLAGSPASDNPASAASSYLNNRILVEIHSRPLGRVQINLLDPVTCASLVEIEYDSSPIEKLHLESFFYATPAWQRIGIKQAWTKEPKFDGTRPRSFAARRGMLFVFAVQSALNLPIELEDAWRGPRSMLTNGDILPGIADDNIAVSMSSERLQNTVSDAYLNTWIKNHGGSDDGFEKDDIRRLGYYGFYMDGTRSGQMIYDANVYFNTASAL